MNTPGGHSAGAPRADDATAGGAKAALPGLGALRVSGADAGAFLHAQFTVDLKRLAPGRGSPAAWCSPKGRVLFLLDVLNLGDEGWLLLAPADEISALIKRLRMFVLRAKVTIDDLRETWSVMGLAGDVLPDTLDAPGATTRTGDAWLWRVTAQPGLAYVIGPHAAVTALWDATNAPAITATRWEALEIDAARARISGALGERFLPQELDLERLQGLHFDKGCYPGQEVIARLKYRGQVKSGLRRARTTGPVAPGDRLYRADAAASVGEVLRVAATADGLRLLVVINFDAVGAPLHLRDALGPTVIVDA